MKLVIYLLLLYIVFVSPIIGRHLQGQENNQNQEQNNLTPGQNNQNQEQNEQNQDQNNQN